MLSELNFQIATNKNLLSATYSILEDAENGLSTEFRAALHTAVEQLKMQIKAIDHYDECLSKSIAQHPECQSLLQLEGVGVLNAINLFIALGCDERIYIFLF